MNKTAIFALFLSLLLPGTLHAANLTNTTNTISFTSLNATVRNYITNETALLLGSVIQFSNSTPAFNGMASLSPLQQSELTTLITGIQTLFPSVANYIQLSTQNITYQYGSFIYNGNLVTPNHGFNFSSADQYTGQYRLYRIKTVKAQSAACIYISLAPAPFCANATTPQKISVPVINGHYGVTGGTTYPLSISFKASLIGTQTAPFNYSVEDITTNTFLTPFTAVTTNNLNVVQSFTIPITDSVEITAGNGGNANYSRQWIDPVTVPTNIVAYLPITLVNTQASAVAANTPVIIGYNTANVLIGYNAVAYQQYELPSLNNTEFFLSNGFVVSSWLSANALNPLTANGVAQSVSSTNALANSQNVVWYVNMPPNFLTANTGASPTNTLYLGWAGNAITTSNVLFSSAGPSGEAPQLSCANPYNTQSCNYGYYDNGYQFWNPSGNGLYDNFNGITLSNEWYSQGSILVDNGITLTANTLGGNTLYSTYIVSYPINTPAAMETLVANIVGTAGVYTAEWDGFTTNTFCYDGGNSADKRPDGYVTNWENGYIRVMSGVNVACTVVTSTSNNIFKTPFSGSENWAATGTVNAMQNYVPTIFFSSSVYAAGSGYNVVLEDNINNNQVQLTHATRQYVYVRSLPPNGIMPYSIFGAVQTPSGGTCTALISSPSNAVVDQGQYQSATVTESNCVSTYTYKVQTVNSITTATVANTITSGSTSATSYLATWFVGANEPTNSPLEVNGIVTDSGANVVTSAYSSAYTANPALVAGMPTASNSVIDNGQYSRITSASSGGTTAYSYQWYTGSSCTSAISGATASTYLASPTSTTTYYYKVTDSASTPNSACSAGVTITVYPTLASTGWTASNAVADYSQYQTLTTTLSGGTSAYTYNYLVYNSVGLVANYLVANTYTQNAYTFQISPAWLAGTFTANLIATDSASTPVQVTNTLTFTVDTALNANPPTPSNPTIDNGQSITLTANPSGGTTPYTYQWYTDSNNNCISLTIITGATSSTYLASPTSNTYYCYIVTDSATVPAAATSSSPTLVTVNPTLSATIGAPTNAIIDVGQYQSVTATVTGGTPNYAYTFNSANSISPFAVANTVIHSGIASTTSVATWYIGSQDTANSPETANVQVTDSAYSPVTVNSVPSVSYKISAALSSVTLASSNTMLDYGQFSTFTGTVTGGASPYTCKFTISNSITAAPVNSITVASASPCTATLYFPSWYAGNTLKANVVVTDSATTNEITASAYSPLGFNSITAAGDITPSTPYIDAGQSITLTSHPSGGTTPYTYTWYTHAGTADPVCNSANVIAGSSSTLTDSPIATNTYEYKAADSATTPTSACSHEDTVTVSPALGTPTISPSNPTIDNTQPVTFSSTWSGGTTDYTAKLYSSATSTCNSGSTLVQSVSSIATGSVSFSAVTPASTTYYCIFVTDSAYSPETTNSVNSEVIVNPTLSTGSITPSAPLMDAGQSIILTANPSGGTTPYTYAWYTHSGTANPVCNAANVITGSSSTLTASPIATNTYNVQITDSATTPNIVCSSPDTITVSAAMSTPTLTLSVTPAITFDNYEIFTASFTGGSSAYTYNYLVYNTVTGALLANYLVSNAYTSNQFSWYVPSADVANTFNANVIITDSAYSPVTVNSIKTSTVSITGAANGAPIFNSPADPSRIIAGQQTTLTITPNPSTDVVELFMTPAGQAQGNYLIQGTGTTSYTLCSGTNYCPSVGQYTFNAYDTDPASNILSSTVYAPYYVQNALTTNEMYYVSYPLTTHTNPTSSVNASWDDTYTSSITLTGQLIGYDIVINSGQTLTTNGFPVIAYNAIINNGVIAAGNVLNGGSGGSGNGGRGANVPASIGGSGGAGGSASASGGHVQGGNTLVPGGAGVNGNGITPIANMITNAWIRSGFYNFSTILAGAGGSGGSGNGGGGTGLNGGGGSLGVYLQANNLYAGIIFAAAFNGVSCSTTNQAPGGGGGGGAILLAYNSVYSTGTYNVLGGAVGSNSLCSTSNYQGGSGGSGNVVAYHWTAQPESVLPSANIIAPQTYPVLITTNTFTGVTFNAFLDAPAGAATQVLTNVANVYYILPSNTYTSDYTFQIVETQGSNTLTLNQSFAPLNMTDMIGQLTFNSLCTPLIQYNPNCAVFPYAANVFAVKPTSWYIKSDIAANQHSNFTGVQYNIDQFSDNALTLPLTGNIILTYAQFSPSISFAANLSANPSLQAQLTQTAFAFQISNSLVAPTSPYTRPLYNILTYSEYTNLALNANTTSSATLYYNNYTLLAATKSPLPAYSNVIVYIPAGNYQMPKITLLNQTAFSTATGYIPVQNNYFDATYSYPSEPVLNIYLIPTLNGSTYAVSATSCNNYAGGDFLKVMAGPSGSQIQAQLYKMSQFPFSVPLLGGGYPYQFYIYTPGGVQIYQSAISSWISPISLSAGCPAINITPVIVPNIQTACTWQNAPGNTMYVRCTGSDRNNLVTQWVINFTNQTSLLYSKTLKSYTVNSVSFIVNYTYPSNKTEYPVSILWRYALGDPPVGSTKITVGIQALGTVLAPEFFYIGLILVLIPLALAYFKQDLWILLEVFIVTLGEMVNFASGGTFIQLLPFTPTDIGIFYIIAASLLIYDFTMRR